MTRCLWLEELGKSAVLMDVSFNFASRIICMAPKSDIALPPLPSDVRSCELFTFGKPLLIWLGLYAALKCVGSGGEFGAETDGLPFF